MTPSRAPRDRSRPAEADRLGLVHPAAFIVLACIGTYWNSLGGPFVWNDQAAIVDNPTIRQLWPIAVAGHPLVNLSFALNYAVGGTEVAGYHLVNIVLHLLSALVLFGIVRRTLRTERGPYPFFEPHGKGVRPLFGGLWSADVLALGAALLWLVHPLNSEAVNYVSARGELLMGLFLFLTLYCAADARGSIHPTHQVLWETASVLCCALGMASSELMLSAPLVVLLYDRVFEFGSFREAIRLRRLLYAALAATWLELGALLWIAGAPPLGLAPEVGVWTHLSNQVQMLAHYLWLTVWPATLVLDYGPPRALTIEQIWPAAVLLAVLVAATVAAWRRRPTAGFLGAAFFLTLAPSVGRTLIGPASGLGPASGWADVGAERHMYVPLAALMVLAVAGAAWLTGRLADRFPSRSKTIVSAAIDVVFVVLLASAVRTVYRSAQYADTVALWSGTVAERPHGRARYALASALIAAGAEDAGIEELRRAAPDIPAAKYALGNELYAVGKMAEAASVLQELMRDEPPNMDLRPARLLLAQTLMAQGKLEESAAEFQTVLNLVNPGNPENLANPVVAAARQGLTELGTAQRIIAADLLVRQRVDEAVAHAREAVRLRPQDAAAYATLGSALAAQGKPDEAIVQFREALRIEPGEQEAQSGLVGALNAPRPGRK